MRLVRLVLRRKLLVAVAASSSVAVLVTGALASPSRPAADDPVVGTWTWKFAAPGKPLAAHGSVTFSKNRTMSWSGENSGTWTRSGSSVTLTWKGRPKTVDRLMLSADNQTMTGTNNAGWRVQGIKKSGEKPPVCRRPSAIPRTPSVFALRQVECVFTITWSVSFYRKVAAGRDIFVNGHGKVRGTDLTNLTPVDNPDDDNENTLALTSFHGRVVLDIESVHYQSPKGLKHKLYLYGRVFRSSVEGCAKGTKIAILVEEDDNGNTSTYSGCSNLPHGSFKDGKVSVAITIKTQ